MTKEETFKADSKKKKGEPLIFSLKVQDLNLCM